MARCPPGPPLRHPPDGRTRIAKQQVGATPGSSALSIGDLARRTGVPIATLRSWELRHGEPRSLPRTTGHRRYDEQAVITVRTILARRASGLTLEAAIDAARSEEDPDRSMFACLRREHPGLAVHDLTKESLLAITRAAEDEYVARAEHAVLFAGFQSGDFFQRSEVRWRELAGIADAAVVFADFSPGQVRDHDPLVCVAIPEASPLQREWFLVCDSDEYSVCVVGRESLADAHDLPTRRFESLWSLDRSVVRTAARLCARRVENGRPDEAIRLRSLLRRLDAATPEPSPDLHRAELLFGRVLSYLSRT